MSQPEKNSQTLSTIELLLLWEGAAGNERLRELFPIHQTHASRVLAQYIKLNPLGLAYSTTHRRWEAAADFSPALTDGSLEEYLACTHAERKSTSAMIVSTHLPFGKANHRDFAVLQRAIREGTLVIGKHASMRNPSPTEKRFYPHTLVEAGRRWHVRGYVEATEGFRDMALTRLTDLQLIRSPCPDIAARERDVAWQTLVALKTVPHPALSTAQRQLVRREYFGGSAARIDHVRAALLPYVLHELRAAVNPRKETPPDYQLAVDQPAQLKQWMLPAD